MLRSILAVDQVQAEMQQYKISQTKLGQQTHISQGIISQWLNRRYGEVAVQWFGPVRNKIDATTQAGAMPHDKVQLLTHADGLT